MAIKEFAMTELEKNQFKDVIKSRAIGAKHYPKEYVFAMMLNDLLIERIACNFLFAYDLATCAGCELTVAHTRDTKMCYLTFSELADSELLKSIIYDNSTVASLLYQLLLGLYSIQYYYGIHHADIKTQNTLIMNIPKGGFIEYIVHGRPYYVQNSGLVPMIADFGLAKAYKPDYALDRDNGTRNCFVHTRVDGTKVLMPIDRAGSGIVPSIIWRDDTHVIKSTNNEFFDGDATLSGLSRQVDLNDTDTYPPQEFFIDTQDVIRMFVGGSKFYYNGYNHSGLSMPRDVKEFIRQQCYVADFPYNGGSYKYLSALGALDAVYAHPNRALRPDEIVGRFTIA
jgi:serine/threonine protein kinase